MTFQFDKVLSSDVGEWNGDEQRAADYLNDVLAILAEEANERFPDPTEHQRYCIEELASRYFFEDLCRHPEKLDDSTTQKGFTVIDQILQIEWRP